MVLWEVTDDEIVSVGFHCTLHSEFGLVFCQTRTRTGGKLNIISLFAGYKKQKNGKMQVSTTVFEV